MVVGHTDNKTFKTEAQRVLIDICLGNRGKQKEEKNLTIRQYAQSLSHFIAVSSRIFHAQL